MERLFRLSERGTNPRTEILAGLSTFLTMAYIVVVNPSIMAAAGHRCRRGLRRHLPRCGDRLDADGRDREFPDRPRAGHGAQRLFRLRRGAGHGRAMAGGAGRGVPLGAAVLRGVRAARAGVAGERHPAVAQIRHRGRDRLLPRADRAARDGAGGGASGNAGGARADRRDDDAARLRRLPADRGAVGARRAGGHRHRHPADRAGGHPVRADQFPGHRLDAALPGADLPATGHRRRHRARHHRDHLHLLHRRPARQHRHPDRHGPSRRADEQGWHGAESRPRPGGRFRPGR